MTKEQKTSYLENSNQCPFCKSDNIEGTAERNYDGNHSDHRIKCLACEKEWLDIYQLCDVEEAQ